MTIWIGTSGYSYREWKGTFYPEDLATPKMLAYYADRFSTVEINNTFYRMPSEKMLTDWANGTPESFSFTLKAPRRITHDARLQDCAELVDTFCSRARTLGPKLGVLLFQLPPYFRKDVGVLEQFIDWVPTDTRAAFEFRHRSWYSDDVYALLKARSLALCVMDNEDSTTPIVSTAPYGYFRLRDEGYQEADFARWADTIMQQTETWEDVFVYFKHEDEGKGPEFARSLISSLATG